VAGAEGPACWRRPGILDWPRRSTRLRPLGSSCRPIVGSHFWTAQTGPGAPALRSTPGPDARALTPQTATRGPRQRMRWTNGCRDPPPSGRCPRRALCPARIPLQYGPPRHSTDQDPPRPMATRARRGSCRDGGRTRCPSVTGAVPRAPPTRPRRARHQRLGPGTSSGVGLHSAHPTASQERPTGHVLGIDSPPAVPGESQ
jgi:hypothetical protein